MKNPFKDPHTLIRKYVLLIARLLIKILVILVAFLLNAGLQDILIILFLILLTELYKNVAALIIQSGKNPQIVGAFVSALDGAIFIFALYFAQALGTDFYLFIILSIILNTAEYGLLSAIVEGIVAGFSYAIFILAFFGYTDTAYFFSTYMLRICSIVFLGWITGWLANDLYDKEKKLNLVLENDIHVEELNEVKTTFVSDAAESLKTPISAIRGYIDIMMNGRVGNLDDKIKEYLTNISKNIMRVDSLVEELLHIIEIEDDSIKLRRKEVNTIEFISSVKNDATAFSKIYNSEITFYDELKEANKISIDEFRLKIALKNILFYLFDVAGKGVSVTFKNDNNYLIIIVNASINDPAVLAVFNTEMNSDTNFQKSTLLKVYTSKLIIESHQGKIEVARLEDHRVAFNIYLPYNK